MSFVHRDYMHVPLRDAQQKRPKYKRRAELRDI